MSAEADAESEFGGALSALISAQRGLANLLNWPEPRQLPRDKFLAAELSHRVARLAEGMCHLLTGRMLIPSGTLWRPVIEDTLRLEMMAQAAPRKRAELTLAYERQGLNRWKKLISAAEKAGVEGDRQTEMDWLHAREAELDAFQTSHPEIRKQKFRQGEPAATYPADYVDLLLANGLLHGEGPGRAVARRRTGSEVWLGGDDDIVHLTLVAAGGAEYACRTSNALAQIMGWEPPAEIARTYESLRQSFGLTADPIPGD